MTTAIYEGINAAYGVQLEDEGQSLPALQATVYQPKNMKDIPQMGMSSESLDMLNPASKLGELCSPVTCNFGDDDTVIWAVPEGTRYAVLGIPKIFILNKETGEIRPKVQGEKLAGTKNVTATRLTLAMVKPDGDLVLSMDGTPQLFTLKLTSSKTTLVTGDKYDPEFKSIRDLNYALQSHFKKRGMSLTHLVSVELGAAPRKFVSKESGQSSLGIMFELRGNAKPLPEPQQAAMYGLLQDPMIQGYLSDPFGINAKQTPQQEQGESVDEYPAEDNDAIPF